MAVTPLELLGARAKRAARELVRASGATKSAALEAAATELIAQTGPILAANVSDTDRARAAGADATSIDRLRLDEHRLAQMAEGLRAVAALSDPIGEVVEGFVRPNGLRVERVRVPLGVVGIIYENRPNVTAGAAAHCLKSGNAALLRGSAGALESN